MRARIDLLRRLRCTLPAPALLLLAACAVTGLGPLPADVPPASGPRATLQVDVSGSSGHYVVSRFEQSTDCSGRRQIATGRLDTAARVTTQIPASGVQTLGFFYETPDGRLVCEVVLSFEAHAGKSYLVRGRREGNNCRMAIGELDAAGRPVAVRTVKRERRGTPTAYNGCMAMNMAALQSAAEADGPGSLDDYRDLLPK